VIVLIYKYSLKMTNEVQKNIAHKMAKLIQNILAVIVNKNIIIISKHYLMGIIYSYNCKQL
jgi:hypothetical protein